MEETELTEPVEEATEPEQEDFPGTPLREALSAEYDKAEEEAPAETISDHAQEEAPEAVIEPPIRAPNSWSKEAREWLTAQPKDVREATELRRKIAEYAATRQEEADRAFTSKTEQLAREREAFQKQVQGLNGVYRTLEPKLKDFHLRGIDPTSWLNEVMAIDELARQDKRQALVHLAQKWNVNPQELIQTQQQNPIPPQLQQELQAQRQQLEQLRGQLTARQQAELQAIEARNNQEVETFLSATDTSGNPLYPHAQRLENEMALEVRVLRAQQPGLSPREYLQKAYDRAVWKNEDTRSEMLSRQAKQKEEQERQAAAKRLAEAKKASSPVMSSPNGQNVSAHKSRRDALEEAWELHTRT